MPAAAVPSGPAAEGRIEVHRRGGPQPGEPRGSRDTRWEPAAGAAAAEEAWTGPGGRLKHRVTEAGTRSLRRAAAMATAAKETWTGPGAAAGDSNVV